MSRDSSFGMHRISPMFYTAYRSELSQGRKSESWEPLVSVGRREGFARAQRVVSSGCGKSTLALSLFRFVEPTEGQIRIDGLDITTVGLTDLRQRVTIIPQVGTLIESRAQTDVPLTFRILPSCLEPLGRLSTFSMSIATMRSTNPSAECISCLLTISKRMAGT